MEFIVTASGSDPFYFNTIASDTDPRHPGIRPVEKRCDLDPATGKCRLLRTVDPILDFFSAVTSHETVEARYQENDERTLLRETGQRVAFVLLVRAMFQSNCPYFDRFSPLLSRYQLAWTQEMFLLASLMARQSDVDPVAAPLPCPLGSNLQEHLFPLLQTARHHLVGDAAVNAVTIMFNLVSLADETDETSRDLTLPSLYTAPLPPATLPPTGA